MHEELPRSALMTCTACRCTCQSGSGRATATLAPGCTPPGDRSRWGSAVRGKGTSRALADLCHTVFTVIAAKTGIARTLERWCLERPELASRLKTQPQAFEEAKSDLMWQARKAMAYVACCVDAPDHHAMQCACDDRGGRTSLSGSRRARR